MEADSGRSVQRSEAERSGVKASFAGNTRPTPPSNPFDRARANLAALRTLRTLVEEHRWASADEQMVLAGYTSWGAASQIFDRRKADWAPLREELQSLVDEKTYNQLAETTLSAFFTNDDLIQPMWRALQRAGYTSGPVLEPGSGTGNFIANAAYESDMVGVEKDSVSAQISHFLYPEATILNQGFEKTSIPRETFSAAIGNVPFGNFRLHDPEHNSDSFTIHNHFIVKSLNLVKPGGYAAFITSSYTSDTTRPDARQAMIDRADLVSAIRLPNQAFNEAGTSVSTDLLVFRVREEDQTPTEFSQQFINADTLTLSEDDSVRVNSVFRFNPHLILGTRSLDKDQYGKTILRVNANGDFLQRLEDTLLDDIDEALEQGLGFSAETTSTLPALQHDGTTHLPGTIVYEETADGLKFQRYSGISGRWETLSVGKDHHDEWRQIIDMRDTATLLRDAYRTESADIPPLQERLATQYDTYRQTYPALNRFTIKPPTKPTKKQKATRYNDLVDKWRTENFLSKKDEPPAELAAQFEKEAASLIVSDTREHKHLGKLKQDPMIPSLLAFEDFNPETQHGSKGDLFTHDPSRPTLIVDHADTLGDAVDISLDRFGVIDPYEVARLLNKDQEAVEDQLVEQRLAFRDPENPKTFIQAERYLSGLIADKLTTAMQCAADDSRFDVNVEALKDVLPVPITEGIVVRPGVHWLPDHIYEDFISETFGVSKSRFSLSRAEDKWFLRVDKDFYYEGGQVDYEWGVIAANNPNRTRFNFRSSQPEAQQTKNQGLATRRNNGVAVNAFEMFEAALNLNTPTMNWSGTWIEDHPGTSHIHPEATAFASRKVQHLQDAFTKWIQDDPDRKAEVYKIYNQHFNSRVATTWDGSKRTMPGLGEAFKPYSYQLNAVERMNNEPAVLLNHAVGAGKTGTFLMGAAELKRLGKIKQPWIVVPNHLTEQVAEDALRWYPRAKVLSGAGISKPEERREFVAQTTAHDWDFVIVPLSVFGAIGMSHEVQEAYIETKIDELRSSQLELVEVLGSDAPSVKQLQRAIKTQEKRLEKLLGKERITGLEFESTMCDYLIIDEAHEFKNLQRTSAVNDLSHDGSQRAADMDMKLTYLRGKAREGAPIVTFATGTPIANNLAEIWVMSKYLRPDLLAESATSSINSWAATFTRQSADVEVKPTGSGLRTMIRSREYLNVGDLAGLCEPFIDTVTLENIRTELADIASLPTLEGGKNTVVEFDIDQQTKDFMADFDARIADMTGKWKTFASIPPLAFDNVAKMLADGKKASIDPRLVNLDYEGFSPRVKAVTENIIDVWKDNRDEIYFNADGSEHPNRGGLQIVFLDSSTPKGDGSYSVYDQLRQSLVASGMDGKRIAFVHEWDKNRSELFKKCREGEIDVLIGSTAKLGTGANIQTRAKALHHMDVPWRPADLEQREGRILRQGNQNKSVRIFNYIARGTTDAVDWQTLYRKFKFINQFWQANRQMRSMEAIDSSSEDAAALNKAVATGDTRYIDLVNLERQVDELTNQRDEWAAAVDSTRLARIHESSTIDSLDELLEWMKPYQDGAQQWSISHKQGGRTWTLPDGQTTAERSDAAREVSKAIKDIFISRGSSKTTTVVTIGGIPFEASYDERRVAVRVVPAGFKTGSSTAHTSLMLTFDSADLQYKEHPKKATMAEYGILARMENRVSDFAAICERAHAARDKAAERYATLTDKATPTFEDEDLLAEATAARDTLRDILAREDQSEKARRLREDRAQRNREHGRKPGWSLRLNPTKTYAEAVEGAEVAEVIIRAKLDELNALYNYGKITFDELNRRREEFLYGTEEDEGSSNTASVTDYLAGASSLTNDAYPDGLHLNTGEASPATIDHDPNEFTDDHKEDQPDV